MIIQLNDNTRMLSALDKVSEGKYFDALCLFARVDSYESMLNQIACLCRLNDTGYAIELYRIFLSKYYFTHNCYRDLATTSEQAVEMLSLFDSALQGDQFDESKLSADTNLLGDYREFSEFDDEEYFDEYEEESTQNGFCDVRSTEYFFRLIQRLHDESEKGNVKLSQDVIEELLAFTSKDESVLEGQMLLCLAEHDYDRGAEFAEKFAAIDDSDNYRATAVAVGLLSWSGKHKRLLQKLLARLIKYADALSDNELMEYVEAAENFIENGELTGRLAEVLFSRYKEVGCEALRMCTRVFCNLGWKKQAREAVLTLTNAVPWDAYAHVLLKFIDSGIEVKLDKSFNNFNVARHIDMPTQLSVIAQYQLVQRLERGVKFGEECVLYTDDYPCLHFIANVCKTYVYRGNSDKFASEATTLASLLFSFTPDDKAEFYDFAKRQLCSFMPEPPVQRDILLKLIKVGYRGKLLVTARKGYYALDVTKLATTDETFLEAFCLCAALRKVDTRRLQRAYDKIKAVVAMDDENMRNAHQLAYCLLALSYKDFVESSVADYFGEEENALYLEYLKTDK